MIHKNKTMSTTVLSLSSKVSFRLFFFSNTRCNFIYGRMHIRLVDNEQHRFSNTNFQCRLTVWELRGWDNNEDFCSFHSIDCRKNLRMDDRDRWNRSVLSCWTARELSSLLLSLLLENEEKVNVRFVREENHLYLEKDKEVWVHGLSSLSPWVCKFHSLSNQY